MQYSEDKKNEGQIAAEEGEKRRDEKKRKKIIKKKKTIIKMDQMWSNQRNLKLRCHQKHHTFFLTQNFSSADLKAVERSID